MPLSEEIQREDARRAHKAELQRAYRLKKRLEREQQKMAPPSISSPQAALPQPPASFSTTSPLINETVTGNINTIGDHLPSQTYQTHTRPKPKPKKKPVPKPPAEKTYTKAEVRGLLLEYARQQQPPVPLTRRERKLQRRKEHLQRQLNHLEPPEEAKYPVTPKEAEQIQQPQSHFKGKRRLRFAASGSIARQEHTLTHPTTTKKKSAHQQGLDYTALVEEQADDSKVTQHSPESINIDGLKDVKKHPQDYLEINLVRKSRVVDTFYINGDRKQFHYKNTLYFIKEEGIYLLPTKANMFFPTCFYKENHKNPVDFRNLNKGITGKALSLLYNDRLYMNLLVGDESKWNLFIVILSIALLIAYAVGCYFVFFHNGGAAPPPDILPPGGA